jgi:hypothetical protein
VFAINVEKGCWEKLKTSAGSSENTNEMQARKKDMAQVILLHCFTVMET